MSVDTPVRDGSDEKDELRQITLAIENARKLAIDGRYRFLTYLLEMARLEARNLQAQRARPN